MGLGDLLRGLTGRDKTVPASEAIPRMRESSGVLKALPQPPSGRQPAVGNKVPGGSEPTPATAAPALAPPPISPPAWSDVFPVHHRALLADLQRRGEDPNRWEIQDGRDLGVSDAGHTIAFRIHKIETSVTIQIELTLFKGKLANVRVR